MKLQENEGTPTGKMNALAQLFEIMESDSAYYD